MRINKIYIIALDPDADGYQDRLEAKLVDMGFYEKTPYEIVKAYDGRNGDIPNGWTPYEKWNASEDPAWSWNDWWTRPVLGGEIGCAVSHRNVWERSVFDGIGLSLVLEEDFLFNGGDMSIASLPDPTVDSNWDIALLGRDKIEKFIENESIDDTWEKSRHFYNLHAYVIKNSEVAKKLLSGGLKEMTIPVDEYVSALGYLHRRPDINAAFPPSLNILGTKNNQYVIQSRGGKNSTIEIEVLEKKLVQNNDILTGNSGAKFYELGPTEQPSIKMEDAPEVKQPEVINTQQEETYYEILDDSDWEAWKEKYLNLSTSKHEFELMVSDKKDNVFEFPLFTPKFCRDVIALAESKDNWTIDRHEFYPTNDVLLQDIGLDDIYNRVMDEVVRPLAIHLWNLEGEAWEGFSNENFMARYTTERQSHLSLHHDRSHLTMVIKLNDEFSGGGTWFPQYQKLSNPPELGTAVLHPGMITHRHGARPITSGKRYIIVSFIRSHIEP